jgi:glutathione S-transferase
VIRLVTIPLSHFCEKARWALDLAGVRYAEDGHAPVLHRLALVRLRTTTVPVLVADGEVVRGSDRILRWADSAHHLGLMPQRKAPRQEVERWLALCDERLGPDARLWFYSFALEDPRLFVAALSPEVRRLERGALSRLRPVLTRIIASHFAVTPTARAEAAERLSDVMAAAAQRRAGAPYLVGETFTAADLAFAALAAPLVFPPGYGATLPAEDALSGELRAGIQGWRATRSGAAVLSLYEHHRPQRS